MTFTPSWARYRRLGLSHLAKCVRQLLMLIRVVALLWGYRLALWLLPFQWLTRWSNPAEHPTLLPEPTALEQRRVARKVERAAAFVPRATCLVRVLTGAHLMAARGHQAEVCYRGQKTCRSVRSARLARVRWAGRRGRYSRPHQLSPTRTMKKPSMRPAFLLLVILSACQVTDPSPVAASEQTGIRVENWQGVEATVSAQVHGDDGPAVAATGTVSAAGELSFGMEPLSASELSRFTACPGVTVSDPTLNLNSFSAFDVAEGQTPLGQLAQASGLTVVTGGLQRIGDYYVQYTYADRPARVEGRCGGGAPASFSYALTLQKGWNPVVFKLIDEGVLELSDAPVPAGAAWFFNGVNR